MESKSKSKIHGLVFIHYYLKLYECIFFPYILLLLRNLLPTVSDNEGLESRNSFKGWCTLNTTSQT